MSRVHDALRKAGKQGQNTLPPPPPSPPPSAPRSYEEPVPESNLPATQSPTAVLDREHEDFGRAIAGAATIPFDPAPDALLIDPSRPRQAPAEEFRSLRTRLNHMQSLQPLQTLVVTSASPAEGKSFTAANLALAQAQLADKRILLCDFDFRRPSVDKTFQVSCAPGLTNYLMGTASLSQIVRRIESTDLYIMTAGDAVPNPLELLNLKECRSLIHGLRDHFDWIIIDSPPLLFAADGNLLSTMSDGTVLVVRVGATTYDTVNRALQSLCENNVLGVVVNGARRGELYSRYSYYHDYEQPEAEKIEAAAVADDEEQ